MFQQRVPIRRAEKNMVHCQSNANAVFLSLSIAKLLKCLASDRLIGAIMSFGLCETSVDDDTGRIKVAFQFFTLPILGFGARLYQNVSKITEKRRFTLLSSGRN